MIGREFSFETLPRVAGMDEDAVVAAVEEALQVGLREDRSRLGEIRYRLGEIRYRFGHAFFRETLYAELSAPRRRRFHQQVALALEEQYGGRSEEHAAELAEHYAHSSDKSDLAKALR